jgi:hypothetical protein
MHQEASTLIRWLYCLAILSVILPFGMSGWVAATVGAGPTQSLPFIGPILLLVLGVWRIFMVARHRYTLDTFVLGGAAKLLRILGIMGMVVGVIYLVLRLTAAPLTRAMLQSRSESGVEFYVVGVLLGLLGGVGPLGILLFEFSRLLGFEQRAQLEESS